jgi:FecR protein
MNRRRPRKRGFRRIMILRCLPFILPLCLSGCWTGLIENVTAIVLATRGSVEIRSGNAGQFRPLSNDMHPGVGDFIRVGDDGRLQLALLPDTLVQLRSNSEMEIHGLRVIKDGDETGEGIRWRHAHLKVIVGRLFVLHEKRGLADTELNVSTPDGDLSAESTCLYRIEVSEGRTRVTCATGSVTFHPSDQSPSFRVSAGSVGRWPLAGGKLLAPATDPRGQSEIATAVEVENDLRVARLGVRNILPR